MTGGRLVILGDTGRNFAAGMSGGIAYIYDPEGKFPERCNMGLVDLVKVEDKAEKEDLKAYIQEHVDHTGSAVGKDMVANFDGVVKDFVKVFPRDYARVLEERRQREMAAEEAA